MMCHTVATPPLQTLLLDGSANRSEGAHCDPLWIMFFSGIAVHGAEIYRKLKYSYERLSSYKSVDRRLHDKWCLHDTTCHVNVYVEKKCV